MSRMRQFAKQILLQVTARIYERRPLSSWPAFLDELHELKVPQSVVPLRSCSPTGPANINILIAMIEATDAVPGDIAECGVYRGATIAPMAIYLRQKGSPKTILGFDSFEGFDESIGIDLEFGGRSDSATKKVGGFSETSHDLVQSKLNRFHLKNTTLVKGFFRDTLPKYREHRFSFVHLDCDIYASYMECLEFFYPRLNSNGILLLDEYNDPPWPGCNLAVDNFLADKPETLQSIVRDNYQKFFLVKD